MTAVEQGQTGTSTENGGQAAGGGTPGAGAAGTGATPTGQSQAGQNGASGQPSGTGATDGQNAMDTVRKMLNNNPAIGAPLQGSFGTGSNSGMGQISGGGIAGVASKAKGHTIKTVNDQTDYSLWEFYYDPTKDAAKAMPGLAGGTQSGVQPGAGTTPGANAGSTSGSTGQSGFGQSSFGQSSFGQSSSNSSSAGTTASPTNTGTPPNPPQ
jgi:hypothetical protein